MGPWCAALPSALLLSVFISNGAGQHFFAGGIGFYVVASTPRLVADVQSFLDAPASKFGWIAMAQNETAFPIKRFDSRENSDSTVRPLLTVELTPPP